MSPIMGTSINNLGTVCMKMITAIAEANPTTLIKPLDNNSRTFAKV